MSKKNAFWLGCTSALDEPMTANLSLAMNSEQRLRHQSSPMPVRLKRHKFFESPVQIFRQRLMVVKKYLEKKPQRVVRAFIPQPDTVKTLIRLALLGALAVRRLAFASICLLVIVANPSRASDQTFKDAAALIDHLEQLYQGGSSEAKMVMEIRTPDYARRLVLHGMTQGDDLAYFQILEPKKDRGIASLMRDEEMWNFLPKINRVVKVPPSMMMNSWMGSDFSNDDLVKQSSLTDLYDLTLTDSETQYFVSLTPKEDTVTVWGRIDYVIEKSPLIPRMQTYFDERGEAVRTLEFSEVKQFGARALPSKMTMTPLRKEGHQTIIRYDSLALDVAVPDEVFTLQYLKRRR
ncbi:MAG: outer membrane lipoprotein-sorting protein [Pseudomonadales bacterium]